MHKIDLQSKAQPLNGTIGYFEMENSYFHYVSFPLFPFETGLAGDNYPVKTEFMIEWLEFGLKDPHQLDGLSANSETHTKAEASITLNNVHNFCHINHLTFKKLEQNQFMVSGELLIKFEDKGIAQNEVFSFEVQSALILAR